MLYYYTGAVQDSKKIALIVIDMDTDLLWDLVSKGSKC